MRRLTITCLTAASLAFPAAAAADTGDVIVRYRSGTDAAERSDVRRAADVTRQVVLPVAATELVDPEPGVTTGEALAALRADANVLYAEPDVERHALRTPSDRLFGYQWGLQNVGQSVGGASGTPDADIDATDAWDAVTGSPRAVVAVIDSGIDAGHPDLAPNLFVSPGEVAGNAIDDDRNGFVDDVSGWDFAARDATPDDQNGHGTHVAGTVAANGDDGRGVTGVAWDAAVLPLRVLGADGSGSVSDTIRAYGYAASAGARVVNLSLGGGAFSRAERDALAAAPNVLFVAAAGNESADNDTTGSFPCNYELPNVVCVAASDRSDGMAGFSNTGARTVDLAAPGVAIVSTYPGGGYAALDGTSMAAPHVAGAAVLLVARQPDARVADLRQALLSTVDARPGLAGRTVTGGRLNAAAALGVVRATQQTASGPASETTTGGDAPQPEPAPAPAPAPAEPAPVPAALPLPPPPDRGPPMLALSISPRSSLPTFLRRGLRVGVRCSERCAIRLTLRRGRTMTVRGSATRTRAGTATVTLRLSARQRARLRGLRSARLELRVQAVDPAGNRRTVVRRLTLRR